MTARSLSTLVFLAITTLWLVGTHVPSPRLPRTPGGDKTAHVVGYALIALSGTWMLRQRGCSRLDAARNILLFCLLLAGIDELTQPLVNRSADWLDWLADLAGALVGLSLGLLPGRRK